MSIYETEFFTRSTCRCRFLFGVIQFCFSRWILGTFYRTTCWLHCADFRRNTAVTLATIFWTEYTFFLQFLLNRFRCFPRFLGRFAIGTRGTFKKGIMYISLQKHTFYHIEYKIHLIKLEFETHQKICWAWHWQVLKEVQFYAVLMQAPVLWEISVS